jgi:hypothetical protein
MNQVATSLLNDLDTRPQAFVLGQQSGPDPGRPEIPHIKTPAVENGLRPILRQFNNGPVAVKLDQPAASDGRQETGSATMHQRRRWRPPQARERLGGRGIRSGTGVDHGGGQFERAGLIAPLDG